MHKYTIKKGVKNYQTNCIDKEEFFVEKELLTLVPKRFLCPFCGKWHKWELEHELSYYDSRSRAAHLTCASRMDGCNERKMRFHFSDGKCHYRTWPSCGRANLALDGSIPISNIVKNLDKPQVTFDVLFTAEECIGNSACSDCGSQYYNCQLANLADASDGRHITLKLGFEFEQSDYNQLARVAQLARKEHELQERENALKVKKQSVQERESALRTKELEQQRQVEQFTQQEIKEDATMANNIFNMNMEFGPSKDENIASTLMGIAVKNGDSWRIYDKKKKEITDVGDMQLGNLPIFILPTTKLNEGDLIKDAGEYYFVIKVANGSTQTLCAKTGEMKTVIPIKNVLGYSCYSKVIALSDSLDFDGDDFDIEELAIMSSMCGQNGESNAQMNQLFLPLMLMREKDDGDDDMKKKKKKMMMIIAMTSMMSSTAEPSEDVKQNSTLNQLFPLMLLKEKDGSDDDMMEMILMSSMMGGNMADNNNPIMSYLMLDMVMGKKKDEKAQQPAQTPNEDPAQ